MLIRSRNAEVGENHGNEEDIVQAERFFNQITGEKQNGGRASVRLAAGEIEPQPMMLIGKEHKDIERKRDADPHAAQYHGFLERYGARLVVDDPQIQRQQEEYKENECRPQPHHESSGSQGIQVPVPLFICALDLSPLPLARRSALTEAKIVK